MTSEEQHDENPELSFWGTRAGNLLGLTLWLSGPIMIAAVAMDWFIVLMVTGVIVTAALIACVVFERRWRIASTMKGESDSER